MEILVISLLAGLSCSVACNAFLYFKLQQSKKKPAITRDAADLLHDLTVQGEAVLRVSVIDPTGLLIWRGQ